MLFRSEIRVLVGGVPCNIINVDSGTVGWYTQYVSETEGDSQVLVPCRLSVPLLHKHQGACLKQL